ncbi:MAG: bacterial Ig-like domain-containing protein, partial [Clostridia bacterium]|nr:bacterial Ig-like domain-containing protein [Clostridia bacterium]
TQYALGESFDTTGMVVQVKYNDGTYKTVTDYTISGFDSSYEGTRTITVKWTDSNGYYYSRTFTVEVIDMSAPQEIYIATLPTKVVYNRRESFDRTGLVVKGIYRDGSEKEITDYTVSGYNALVVGKQTITIKYNDLTTTFDVLVGATAIEISKTPKTMYYIGEEFDSKGLEIQLVCSNGDSMTVTDRYTVSGFDSKTVGYKELTVEYLGFTTSLTVYIMEEVVGGEYTNILLNKEYQLSGCGERSVYYANLTDGIASSDLTDAGSNWFGFYCNGTDPSIINAPDGIGYAIFDLGGVYRIDKIRTNLICNESWGFNAPKEVNAYISDDGINWVGIGSFDYQLEAGVASWTELNGDWITKYIKVEYVLSGVWAVTNEIEAYGVEVVDDDTSSDDTSSDDESSEPEVSEPDDPSNYTNILLNKDYQLSGCGERSTYYANLTDGIAADNLATEDNHANWFGFYCNGTDPSIINAPNRVGYAIFDLGGIYNIDRIRTNIICNTSWGVPAPEAINAYISDDGATWEYVGSFEYSLEECVASWTELNGNWTTKYLKVEYVLAGVFAWTNEIEAYGIEVDDEDTSSDDTSSDDTSSDDTSSDDTSSDDTSSDDTSSDDTSSDYTEGLEFSLSDDGTYYIVSDYTGTATEVVIPSEYKGIPVASIRYSAFAENSIITNVTIPDSVTNIDAWAFSYCYALTSITIPASVISIGDCAFFDCYALTDIYCEAKGYPDGWSIGCMHACKAKVHWNACTASDSRQHTYVCERGKLVCKDCGEVSDYSGLYENDGVYYCAENGILVNGWQEIDGAWYYFGEDYAALNGEYKIGGVWFNFDETGKTEGTWANTLYGKRYYYGPSYYENGWKTIKGEDYYFDGGYPVIGINKLDKWYNFDETGVCLGTLDGVCEIDGIYYYLEDGIGAEKYLI